MNWQNTLKELENAKSWDSAIKFMQDVIAKNPNDMNAYMSINYLIMNLLVEEDYDENKLDYYMHLIKKYFDESYAKFSNNAEYLFYTGKTAVMSEWFFGIKTQDYEKMLNDAMQLDPNNMLYQETYYINLDLTKPDNKIKALNYAKLILKENSPIQRILKEKGSMGEYLLELIVNWSKRVVKNIDTCGTSIYT